MINSRHHLMLATALAAGLVVAAPLATGQVRAEESATVPTNPGFKPDTGQINPGVTKQAPSTSTDTRQVPTPAEARAALMAPDDPNPVLGAEPPQVTSSAAGDIKAVSPQAAGGDPTARETTGARSRSVTQDRPGPIGATGQTMPVMLSSRNDILDRVPIMAWPLLLSDQQRQQIYQAVMADKSQPAAGAEALAPASELSTEQALNGMHALPDSVRDIAVVNKLQYVKAKDRVLLVEPSTRIVVEQIKS